jgi:hypothetical protein
MQREPHAHLEGLSGVNVKFIYSAIAPKRAAGRGFYSIAHFLSTASMRIAFHPSKVTQYRGDANICAGARMVETIAIL